MSGTPIRLAALLTLGLLTGACAAARGTLPDQGGAPWSEVTSPHFRIRTNLPAEQARELAVQLERHRRGMTLQFGGFDPPGITDAVALENADQVLDFTKSARPGFAGASRDGRVVVFGADELLDSEGAGADATAVHELAHDVLFGVLQRQPRWLAEGYAQYLETTHLPHGQQAVELGRVKRSSIEAIRALGYAPLARMWQWEQLSAGLESDDSAALLYPSSWLWVHYLIDTQGKRFAQFLEGLHAGKEPREAWEAGFAGITTAQLEDGLANYVSAGTFKMARLPLPEAPVDVQVRPLPPARVHALRAELLQRAPRERDAEATRAADVDGALAAALRLDAAQPEAALLRAARQQVSDAERVELGRRLTAAHADSVVAWAALAEALLATRAPPTEVEAAAQAGLTHAPADPALLDALAWARLGQRDLRGAYEAAGRGLKADPGNIQLVLTLATVSTVAGNCGAVESYRLRALDALHPEASAAARQDLDGRFRTLAGKCRPAGP